MNIAIVGKNSYIGTRFINYVSNTPDFNIVTFDSRNTPVDQMDFAGIDVVLHLAGIAHVSRKKSMKDLYYKINRDLAINTALKAKADGVKQFIFMSSMIIYGKDAKIGKSKIITEETIPSPVDFYGQSKLEADLEIQSMNSESFKTVVIRCPMVYGPNCKGNFPRIVRLGLILPFFPNIKNERSMIYIDNLCYVLKMIITNDFSGIFFPQNQEYVSTVDIIRIAREHNNKKVRLIKIFNHLIKFLSLFISTFNKVFGNKVYKKINNYMLIDQTNFKDSIIKSIM